jgi:hypothetical protein
MVSPSFVKVLRFLDFGVELAAVRCDMVTGPMKNLILLTVVDIWSGRLVIHHGSCGVSRN